MKSKEDKNKSKDRKKKKLMESPMTQSETVTPGPTSAHPLKIKKKINF